MPERPHSRKKKIVEGVAVVKKGEEIENSVQAGEGLPFSPSSFTTVLTMPHRTAATRRRHSQGFSTAASADHTFILANSLTNPSSAITTAP